MIANKVTRVAAYRHGVAAPLCSFSIQKRNVHDSYIPQGRGGRSSFSGMVTTVFGCTGLIGHSVVNRLGRIGSNLMLPHRGSDQHICNLKVMADLGQMMLRYFRIKEDDDKVRELIKYSNCVVNLIGSNIPYNHYSLKEVNLEWPLRLASLVAEKNDGTRLLHVTNLNCHLAEGRRVSKLLELDHLAEVGMRELYPATICVRSSNVFGVTDTYTQFLLSERFENDLSWLGALPLLYDNGTSTMTQPVYVGDVAEAIVRILRHLDSEGRTFELLGPARYLLKDFAEYIYKISGKESYMYDTLGPMNSNKANLVQKCLQSALDLYFQRQTMPRIRPRFFDMMSRRLTPYEQWASKDYFNQVHLSDIATGKPGLEELGIEPTRFEDKAYFLLGPHHDYSEYKVPTEENFKPMREYPSHAQRITSG